MANVVNTQITDAVTQTNVKVVAESPALAESSLYELESELPPPPADQTGGAIEQGNLPATADAGSAPPEGAGA